MDTSLSKKQKLLLLKGAKNNGIITKRLAEEIYSSWSQGKSAIEKLEALDFIERSHPGVWRVKKAIDDVKSSFSLTEQNELLLMKAAKNDGVLNWEMASNLYSSKRSAKSAIQTLVHLGYVENTVPGQWKVKNVTDIVAQEVKEES
ncbi:hypothetical protein [Haloplanus natans]|uniref:hypothetical protein n=1 Tax=Haloplanus natans TaxID=376171 RepID=UPI0012F78DF3|nr:hypothetical protein [Haloplanus natans]